MHAPGRRSVESEVSLPKLPPHRIAAARTQGTLACTVGTCSASRIWEFYLSSNSAMVSRAVGECSCSHCKSVICEVITSIYGHAISQGVFYWMISLFDDISLMLMTCLMSYVLYLIRLMHMYFYLMLGLVMLTCDSFALVHLVGWTSKLRRKADNCCVELLRFFLQVRW